MLLSLNKEIKSKKQCLWTGSNKLLLKNLIEFKSLTEITKFRDTISEFGLNLVKNKNKESGNKKEWKEKSKKIRNNCKVVYLILG